MNKTHAVSIYTDGSCIPNPGKGGWAAIIIVNNGKSGITKLSGSDPYTTNNRMELTSAIEALKSLNEICVVDLYTDSQYLQQGITNWIISWKERNWRTANGRVVKNYELWQELQIQVERHTITWHWIKGHAGNQWNEMVNKLAQEAMLSNGKDVEK